MADLLWPRVRLSRKTGGQRVPVVKVIVAAALLFNTSCAQSGQPSATSTRSPSTFRPSPLPSPSPSPTLSESEAAYIAELNNLEGATLDIRGAASYYVKEGRERYCSAVPTEIPATTEGPDPSGYRLLVENLGKLASTAYDEKWRTRLRLAVTHLCPERLPVLDAATAAAVPTIDSGKYEVGKEIPPGTWRAEDVTNCYWERTAADGNIIENNFVAAAKRIDVRVRSTDAFFISRSCKTWFKVG